jgi:hypothetical protein
MAKKTMSLADNKRKCARVRYAIIEETILKYPPAFSAQPERCHHSVSAAMSLGTIGRAHRVKRTSLREARKGKLAHTQLVLL